MNILVRSIAGMMFLLWVLLEFGGWAFGEPAIADLFLWGCSGAISFLLLFKAFKLSPSEWSFGHTAYFSACLIFGPLMLLQVAINYKRLSCKLYQLR